MRKSCFQTNIFSGIPVPVLKNGGRSGAKLLPANKFILYGWFRGIGILQNFRPAGNSMTFLTEGICFITVR
jgi:hypothetical protein